MSSTLPRCVAVHVVHVGAVDLLGRDQRAAGDLGDVSHRYSSCVLNCGAWITSSIGSRVAAAANELRCDIVECSPSSRAGCRTRRWFHDTLARSRRSRDERDNCGHGSPSHRHRRLLGRGCRALLSHDLHRSAASARRARSSRSDDAHAVARRYMAAHLSRRLERGRRHDAGLGREARTGRRRLRDLPGQHHPSGAAATSRRARRCPGCTSPPASPTRPTRAASGASPSPAPSG